VPLAQAHPGRQRRRRQVFVQVVGDVAAQLVDVAAGAGAR